MWLKLSPQWIHLHVPTPAPLLSLVGLAPEESHKGCHSHMNQKGENAKRKKNKSSTDHLRSARKPVLLLHVIVKGSVGLERLVTYLANLNKRLFTVGFKISLATCGSSSAAW